MATVKTPPAAAPSFIRSKLFLVLIFGIFLLLALAACVVQYTMYEREKAVLREDIRYARYETFIDLVKQRLDTEMPEGGWVIDKYCDYANQKASDPVLGCDYSVKSTHQVDNDKFYVVISSFSEGNELVVPEYNPNLISRRLKGKFASRCTVYGGNDVSFATVDCGYLSQSVRYPLRDQ